MPEQVPLRHVEAQRQIPFLITVSLDDDPLHATAPIKWVLSEVASFTMPIPDPEVLLSNSGGHIAGHPWVKHVI